MSTLLCFELISPSVFLLHVKMVMFSVAPGLRGLLGHKIFITETGTVLRGNRDGYSPY